MTHARAHLTLVREGAWTIDRWYDNWQSNKEKVLEKYGQKTFRMYEIFLGWSVEIAREGGSSAWQIVCHKNTNEFDRSKFVGKMSLGETELNKGVASLIGG